MKTGEGIMECMEEVGGGKGGEKKMIVFYSIHERNSQK